MDPDHNSTMEAYRMTDVDDERYKVGYKCSPKDTKAKFEMPVSGQSI